MTIEIRQLIIRAVAEPRDAAPEAPAPAPAESPPRPHAATTSPHERRALIAACVREVLRELRRTQGR